MKTLIVPILYLLTTACGPAVNEFSGLPIDQDHFNIARRAVEARFGDLPPMWYEFVAPQPNGVYVDGVKVLGHTNHVTSKVVIVLKVDPDNCDASEDCVAPSDQLLSSALVHEMVHVVAWDDDHEQPGWWYEKGYGFVRRTVRAIAYGIQDGE